MEAFLINAASGGRCGKKLNSPSPLRERKAPRATDDAAAANTATLMNYEANFSHPLRPTLTLKEKGRVSEPEGPHQADSRCSVVECVADPSYFRGKGQNFCLLECHSRLVRVG